MPAGVRSAPIALREFAQSLWKAHPDLKLGSFKRQNIAIAVSGGADSTALAKLCAQLGRDEYPNLHFTALIVDHGARNGSHEEASLVKERMTKIGLPAEILPLQWPEAASTGVGGFETQARTLRYQALGRECWKRQIPSLLIGHHEDDQAETVLLRIARGQRSIGLQSIIPAGDIPECFGIYGVHRSGSLRVVPNRVARFRKYQVDPRMLLMVNEIGFEDGGIRAYRPLLGFSKERIIATCIEHDLEWVEDETNQDPSLTQRNAIRHLLYGHRLPRAIQKPSLLAIAKQAGLRNEDINRAAATMFNTCKILSFDMRSSLVTVSFPKMFRSTSEGSSLADNKDDRLIALEVLRRVVEIVSPLENVAIQRLGGVIKEVFPELSSAADPKEKNESKTAFTCCGVYAQKFQGRTSLKLSRQGTDSKMTLDDLGNIWSFSRQPWSRAKSIASSPVPITISPTEDETLSFKERLDDHPWHLWDGRYWMQIYNHTPHPVTLRHLKASDLSHLRQNSQKTRNRLRRLASAAPGGVRWTLPVIADHNGAVISIPTLGVTREPESGLSSLKVQLRYKKVDLGSGDPSRLEESMDSTLLNKEKDMAY
ncbi:MAG: hypothetical protein M4579_001285 [Chaenotheca gracillima]|nr:MAG: hypothetical protein M4579_001285 [Chaenotheca gracillima]